MSAALQLLVFAAAAGVSIAAIVAAVAPQWRRIARLARGHVEPPADRWRKMHLEADRRPPFQIRAAAPQRRGLLGRRTQR